jgi:hypothetical protein
MKTDEIERREKFSGTPRKQFTYFIVAKGWLQMGAIMKRLTTPEISTMRVEGGRTTLVSPFAGFGEEHLRNDSMESLPYT